MSVGLSVSEQTVRDTDSKLPITIGCLGFHLFIGVWCRVESQTLFGTLWLNFGIIDACLSISLDINFYFLSFYIYVYIYICMYVCVCRPSFTPPILRSLCLSLFLQAFFIYPSVMCALALPHSLCLSPLLSLSKKFYVLSLSRERERDSLSLPLCLSLSVSVLMSVFLHRTTIIPFSSPPYTYTCDHKHLQTSLSLSLSLSLCPPPVSISTSSLSCLRSRLWPDQSTELGMVVTIFWKQMHKEAPFDLAFAPPSLSLSLSLFLLVFLSASFLYFSSLSLLSLNASFVSWNMWTMLLLEHNDNCTKMSRNHKHLHEISWNNNHENHDIAQMFPCEKKYV